MSGLHRIAWVDRACRTGWGDYMRGTIDEAEFLADAMNDAYPEIFHWVQSAWTDGEMLRGPANPVRSLYV